MTLSAFDDPDEPPTPETLAAVLAGAAPLWSELVATVRDLGSDVAETWSFGSPKTGWSMRLLRGDRVLLYLTPQAGQALVGAVLGEKAIAAAGAAGRLSPRTRQVIDAAPRYAEGRGVRMPMATVDDLRVATELARVKLGVNERRTS